MLAFPALLGAFFILILAVAARADAFVYYSNWNGGVNGTIGRANTAGTGVKQDFIPSLGDQFPTAIRVNGSFIYWANQSDLKTLSRANLNGSGVNDNFLPTIATPTGVAINGANIFWTQIQATPTVVHNIGKANLNGSGAATQDLITDATGPSGLAVDSQHIYWADQAGGGQIGISDLDGGNEDLTFIQPPVTFSAPNGVAVDGQHIYWANFNNGTIGRADLPNGDNAISNFVSGANNPCDVAVHGSHLYWANFGNSTSGSIGRADISGGSAAGVNQNFITAASGPCGVAVDDLSVPSCSNASVSTPFETAKGLTLPCTAGGGTRTFSIVSGPAHGSIVLNTSTGKLTYTPDSGFHGTDSLRYRDRNAGATSNTATATITVEKAPNGFTLGTPIKNKKKGTAELPISDVPGAGQLDLSGPKVKDAFTGVLEAGGFTLPIKAKGKAKKKLKKKGKAKVAVDVTFSPEGGDPATQSAK